MQEKHNIDIIYGEKINKEDGELLDEIKKVSVRGEVIDLEILEKNKEEKEAIQELNVIVGDFFEEAGFERLSLEEECVHIVSSESFDENRKSSSSEAFFKDGHIYIPRTGNVVDFVCSLSHEMMHDFSYLKTKAGVKIKENDEIVFVNIKRRGYGLHTAKHGTLGVGITEGMCELMTIPIRKRYVERNNIEGTEKEKMRRLSYYPQILVLEDVFRILDGDNEEESDSYYKFIRGYLFGERDALSEISKKFIKTGRKNGLKILFEMGGDSESAFETAKRLNLKNAEGEIGKFIMDKAREEIGITMDLIKEIFHIRSDKEVDSISKMVTEKIKRERRNFVSEDSLRVYLEDVFERLHNEDYVIDIFESGDNEKIEEYAKYVGISGEKVDLMKYYAALRKEIISKMKLDLAERKIAEKGFNEREKIIRIFEEQIEPHVRDAVYRLNRAGFETVYSGFWGMEHQSIGFKEGYFKDFEFNDDFLNRMKTMGVEMSIRPGVISFEVTKKLTLKELKNIWDQIVEELIKK